MLELENRVIAKVSRHLIPFLMVCYFIAYLDRVNVGFAALTMNKDLGFTPTIFGWGAGIFFLGYFIFEVPSNIALERFGARMWIAQIMATWGILSICMAFIWSATSFWVVRFLLGVAEAGFFPGIILFLTYSVPLRLPRPLCRLLHGCHSDFDDDWCSPVGTSSWGSRVLWASGAGNGYSS